MSRFVAAAELANHFRAGQLSLLLFAVMMLVAQPGCVMSRGMSIGRRDPMAGAPRLRNIKDPQLEEVVSHLNRNTARIQSWRANNVRIHANQWPLSGSLAVEKGRHVRLIVSSAIGNEVDMGSNDQRFWVWSRRMEPTFVTCKHENVEVARHALGVPFEPDWLMEALGVAPLPLFGVELEFEPNKEHARLVQQITSTHGKPLRRVVLVNLKRSVVVEHCLYDYDGKRIALARLSGHSPDKKTGAVLPHRVILDWPQNQMSLTMDLGKIQVNPESIPSDIWSMPDLGEKVTHLDESLPARGQPVQTASSAHLGPIEDPSANEDDDSDEQQMEGGAANLTGHARLSDTTDEAEDEEDENENEPAAWAKESRRALK